MPEKNWDFSVSVQGKTELELHLFHEHVETPFETTDSTKKLRVICSRNNQSESSKKAITEWQLACRRKHEILKNQILITK